MWHLSSPCPSIMKPPQALLPCQADKMCTYSGNTLWKRVLCSYQHKRKTHKLILKEKINKECHSYSGQPRVPRPGLDKTFIIHIPHDCKWTQATPSAHVWIQTAWQKWHCIFLVIGSKFTSISTQHPQTISVWHKYGRNKRMEDLVCQLQHIGFFLHQHNSPINAILYLCCSLLGSMLWLVLQWDVKSAILKAQLWWSGNKHSGSKWTTKKCLQLIVTSGNPQPSSR